MQFRVIKCGLQPRTIHTPDFVSLPLSLFRGLKHTRLTIKEEQPWQPKMVVWELALLGLTPLHS